MKGNRKKIETRSAHSRRAVIANEPLVVPIYQTSTYKFGSVAAMEKYLEGDSDEYLYTRYENPTLRALQEKIADLEGGDCCYVFSSGMAAITSSLLAFLKEGDEVVASDSLYGRAQIFIEKWLPRFGVRTKLVPLNEFPDIGKYMSSQTKIVYIESPTNPTLRIIDIAATAAVAHQFGARLLIDNTFASPVNQSPIALGADVVLHSLTKYMGGHSDVIAGASIFSAKDGDAIRESIRTFGGTMDPLAAFLVERGLKTLPLRVNRQNQTAMYLATRCEQHSQVRLVNYPGLESHPQHSIAKRQMSGFGGMFSIDLGSFGAARTFVDRLKLIVHGASLGGVETLVSLPVLSSHHGQSPENLKAAGISEGTVRFSAGIEDASDLWEDIEQALES